MQVTDFRQWSTEIDKQLLVPLKQKISFWISFLSVSRSSSKQISLQFFRVKAQCLHRLRVVTQHDAFHSFVGNKMWTRSAHRAAEIHATVKWCALLDCLLWSLFFPACRTQLQRMRWSTSISFCTRFAAFALKFPSEIARKPKNPFFVLVLQLSQWNENKGKQGRREDRKNRSNKQKLKNQQAIEQEHLLCNDPVQVVGRPSTNRLN